MVWCLVKRSEAMLGSNLARDSQVRTGEWPIQASTDSAAGAVFLLPHLLGLPCLRKPAARVRLTTP
jgi:hypothetical protein